MLVTINTGLTKSNLTKKLFRVYLICVLLLAVLPINSAGGLNNVTILKFRGDYFLHSLMLVPWMIFLLWIKSNWWLWLLSGLLFAAFIEGIQYVLPYRAYNVNDLVANIIGVGIGGGILLMVQRCKGTKVQRLSK